MSNVIDFPKRLPESISDTPYAEAIQMAKESLAAFEEELRNMEYASPAIMKVLFKGFDCDDILRRWLDLQHRARMWGLDAG